MCGSPARGSRVQGRLLFGWQAIGSVVPAAGCGSQATGSKIRCTLYSPDHTGSGFRGVPWSNRKDAAARRTGPERRLVISTWILHLNFACDGRSWLRTTDVIPGIPLLAKCSRTQRSARQIQGTDCKISCSTAGSLNYHPAGWQAVRRLTRTILPSGNQKRVKIGFCLIRQSSASPIVGSHQSNQIRVHTP
jgi:hypothetical protein